MSSITFVVEILLQLTSLYMYHQISYYKRILRLVPFHLVSFLTDLRVLFSFKLSISLSIAFAQLSLSLLLIALSNIYGVSTLQ